MFRIRSLSAIIGMFLLVYSLCPGQIDNNSLSRIISKNWSLKANGFGVDDHTGQFGIELSIKYSGKTGKSPQVKVCWHTM